MEKTNRQTANSGASAKPEAEFDLLDAWWRAANYLSVGQIYLLDNPLLQRPLALDDVKPRLLGHWGTTPGLNFIYRAAHLKQMLCDKLTEHRAYIRAHGEDMPEIRNWKWPAEQHA